MLDRIRQINMLVAAVEPRCGEPGWTVHFGDDLWMTVYPEDVPHTPGPGDVLRVQIPRVLGYAGEEISQ